MKSLRADGFDFGPRDSVVMFGNLVTARRQYFPFWTITQPIGKERDRNQFLWRPDTLRA
jgi:hypothetical protein